MAIVAPRAYGKAATTGDTGLKFGPKLGGMAKAVASVGLGVSGTGLAGAAQKGSGPKYGQCWVFSGILCSAKPAANSGAGGVVDLDERHAVRHGQDRERGQRRQVRGPRDPKGSPVMADGATWFVRGGWSFDDGAGQDSSKIATVAAPTELPAAGHFVDDWQGETAPAGIWKPAFSCALSKLVG